MLKKLLKDRIFGKESSKQTEYTRGKTEASWQEKNLEKLITRYEYGGPGSL